MTDAKPYSAEVIEAARCYQRCVEKRDYLEFNRKYQGHPDSPFDRRDRWIAALDAKQAEVDRLIRDSQSAGAAHVRARSKTIHERDEARGERDEALALLGEAASYDYGSSWPKDLRDRIDALLAGKEQTDEQE